MAEGEFLLRLGRLGRKQSIDRAEGVPRPE